MINLLNYDSSKKKVFAIFYSSYAMKFKKKWNKVSLILTSGFSPSFPIDDLVSKFLLLWSDSKVVSCIPAEKF